MKKETYEKAHKLHNEILELERGEKAMMKPLKNICLNVVGDKGYTLLAYTDDYERAEVIQFHLKMVRAKLTELRNQFEKLQDPIVLIPAPNES